MKRIIRRALPSLMLLLVLSISVAPAAAQANVTGQWSTLSYTMPINPIHAALLHNGKVLIVAGSGNCPPSQSGCPSGPPYGPSNSSGATLWDPVAGTITQFSVSWDMFCNGMVVLPDGRAFIIGGTIQYDPFYGALTSAVFDPATNTFTNMQNMAHGRWYPTVTTLGDGRVMSFSGLNETGGTNTAVEIYTVGTGWSTQYIASWTPPLYPRMHLLPNGNVFYSGSTTSSALFNPATTTWTRNVATTNYSGTRTYGTSVLLPLTPANNYDPKIMIMGGNSPATNTTEIIDMGASSPEWVYGPNMSEARIEMNAVILPNGKVLALGGSVNDEDTSSLSLNADLFDPNNPSSFSSAGANASERLYHSVALLLPDATVWLAGGNPARGTYNNTMEIYQPAYLFNSSGGAATRPTISSAPSAISYGSAFTVQTPNAASISSAVLVRDGAVTHSFNTDQRLVGMSFTVGSGSLTVTAPPSGNIAPPGYYMLFLLNSSGVPSVASFVQLVAQPDFSFSATPSSGTVVQGNGTTYTVTVTPSNGFTGTLSLSVSGLPSGATASFNPASITTSGNSTLTINTAASTPPGSYPLTITATNGTLSHSTTVTLVVTVFTDFSISASPTSRTMKANSSTTYGVTVGKIGPFTGTVSMSVTGLPSQTTASFTPSSVTGSGSSTLNVKAKQKAPPGTYTLKITGSSGGVSHSINVGLTIQ